MRWRCAAGAPMSLTGSWRARRGGWPGTCARRGRGRGGRGVGGRRGGGRGVAAAGVDGFAGVPGCRVAELASAGCDAGVLEVCVAFASGGTLVVPPPGGPVAGADLAGVLRREA